MSGGRGDVRDRDPETASARRLAPTRAPRPVSTAAAGRDHQRLVKRQPLANQRCHARPSLPLVNRPRPLKTIGFFAPQGSEELGSCAVRAAPDHSRRRRRPRRPVSRDLPRRGSSSSSPGPAVGRRAAARCWRRRPTRSRDRDLRRVAAKLGLIQVAGSLSIPRLRRRP